MRQFHFPMVPRVISWIVFAGLCYFVAIKVYFFATWEADANSTGFLFSRKYALETLMLLAASTGIFTMLFGTNTFFPLSNGTRAALAKWIDLAWYPLGIATAILGIYGAQLFEAKREYLYRVLAKQDLTFEVNQRAESLDAACSNLSNMEVGEYVRLDLLINGKAVSYARKVEDLCAHVSRPWGSVTTALGGDPLDIKSLSNITAYDLTMVKCGKLLGYGDLSINEYGIRLNDVEIGNKGATLEAHQALLEIAEYCSSSVRHERVDRQLISFEKQISQQHWVNKNPWFWMSLVSILAGLKLSKSIIEIRLQRAMVE